jgi:replicative DNA helicase
MSAGRVPPHDLDAEAAVLSAVLLSREALDRVLEILKPEHFYSDANGRVYEAALELALQGTPVDITTVASWLRDRERLAQIGGAGYLAQLADATPAVAHVAAHAAVVFDKWRLRQLIARCQKIAAEGYGNVGPVQEFLDAAEQAILSITTTDPQAGEAPTLGEAIVARAGEVYNGTATAGGIRTGLSDVDRLLGPMRPGNLVVVGAHSGVGKTSYAMQAAVSVASAPAQDPVTRVEGPVSVGVFSMEMSRAELADRAALAALGIDTSKAARGALDDGERSRFFDLAELVRTRGVFSNIYVDDRPMLSPTQIRTAARRLASRARREGRPLRLLVVDYLQLIDGSGGVKNQERREREVAYCSAQMKAMAKELGVVVVALAQLNEDARTSNRLPRGEDLRESKAIRADADKVILLHNGSAMARRSEMRMGDEVEAELGAEVVDVIIDKSRGGREGRTAIVFWPQTSSFAPITRDGYEAHLAQQRAAFEAAGGGRKGRR